MARRLRRLRRPVDVWRERLASRSLPGPHGLCQCVARWSRRASARLLARRLPGRLRSRCRDVQSRSWCPLVLVLGVWVSRRLPARWLLLPVRRVGWWRLLVRGLLRQPQVRLRVGWLPRVVLRLLLCPGRLERPGAPWWCPRRVRWSRRLVRHAGLLLRLVWCPLRRLRLRLGSPLVSRSARRLWWRLWRLRRRVVRGRWRCRVRRLLGLVWPRAGPRGRRPVGWSLWLVRWRVGWRVLLVLVLRLLLWLRLRRVAGCRVLWCRGLLRRVPRGSRWWCLRRLRRRWWCRAWLLSGCRTLKALRCRSRLLSRVRLRCQPLVCWWCRCRRARR